MFRKDMWGDEFPFTHEVTYLNSATQCPVSRSTARIMQETAESLMCPHILPDVAGEIRAAQESLARLMGAGADEIGFVANTSDGISLAAAGLPIAAGENIVLFDPDHQGLLYPWLHLKDRDVQIRQIPWTPPAPDLNQLFDRVDSRTRVIAMSSVQWANGYRVDLEQVGKFCRDREIFFVVDAVQHLGVLPIDVHRCHISVLAAGGYKWLLAGRGNGCLFINRDIVERFTPPLVGRHGVMEELREDGGLTFLPDARRVFTGCWNMPGIRALRWSVDWLLDIGIPEIEAHVTSLTELLIEGLDRLGLELQSPRASSSRGPIVAFSTGDQTRDEAWPEALRARQVFLTRRMMGLRASVHLYNDHTDVERLLAVLEDLL